MVILISCCWAISTEAQVVYRIMILNYKNCYTLSKKFVIPKLTVIDFNFRNISWYEVMGFGANAI